MSGIHYVLTRKPEPWRGLEEGWGGGKGLSRGLMIGGAALGHRFEGKAKIGERKRRRMKIA